MGKFIAILSGVVAVILGVWGLIAWWSAFVLVFKGTVPAFLILVGIIALIAGIGEVKDSLIRNKEEENDNEEESSESAEESEEKNDSSENSSDEQSE